jgi:carboxyl-terminal processing protease
MNILGVAGIFIGLALCGVAMVLGQPNDPEEIDPGIASLDTVWQTVNEFHYDPTFGGVDWQEIHDRYRKLADRAEDDDALIKLMNDMLRELKVSHYSVFRMDKRAGSGSPLISGGSIGIDLRILGDDAVVTYMDPDFPAAQAGMKPGYVIKSINGVPVQEMIDEAAARPVPHSNERARINNMCDEVVKCCFGQPGDTVAISYEDDTGISHDVTLQMKQRPNGTKIAEEFPTVYVDFKFEKLNNDIGYIYFSAVIPPADSLFVEAMKAMGDIRGLIIDIRGNPGGMHEIGEAIASKLLSESTLFSIFRYRDSTVEVTVDPDPPIFEGPVAILIDVMNGSASERFSGCMQSVGRATIIGERSPGVVGPSDMKELPNGATLMYLVAQSLTPDGIVLEGRGVIPDIIVPLDREALLAGRDTQIERAIEYLMKALE